MNKRSHFQHDDPFPEASLLDTIDAAQHGDVTSVVKDLEESALKSGHSAERHTELQYTGNENIDVFRFSLSTAPPVNMHLNGI